MRSVRRSACGPAKGYARAPLQVAENTNRVLAELDQAKGNGFADLNKGCFALRIPFTSLAFPSISDMPSSFLIPQNAPRFSLPRRWSRCQKQEQDAEARDKSRPSFLPDRSSRPH